MNGYVIKKTEFLIIVEKYFQNTEIFPKSIVKKVIENKKFSIDLFEEAFAFSKKKLENLFEIYKKTFSYFYLRKKNNYLNQVKIRSISLNMDDPTE